MNVIGQIKPTVVIDQLQSDQVDLQAFQIANAWEARNHAIKWTLQPAMDLFIAQEERNIKKCAQVLYMSFHKRWFIKQQLQKIQQEHY